ncbi:MAG: hypothetical protein ILO53_08665 [Clostridia bacterium]|nr:hypothetical protein [Clostridia bacterium]
MKIKMWWATPAKQGSVKKKKKGLTQINEDEAVVIAEQIFRKYFDVDYSMYSLAVNKDDSSPTMSCYDINFWKNSDYPIGITDSLYVSVGLYGEIIWFYGLSIDSITAPEEIINVDDVQQCIEKRLDEVFKDNKFVYSDLKVNIDGLVLGYDAKESRYEIRSIFTFDCIGRFGNGEEQTLHDRIQIIIKCNFE